MVLRKLFCCAVLASCLFGVLLAVAQVPRSQYDPAANAATTSPKVEHCDKDYGQLLDDARTIALETTVENGFFWSNLVALGFVAALGCGVLLLLMERTHREILVSQWLACYHNELVQASNDIAARTEKYEQLKSAVDRQSDSQVAPQKQPPTPGVAPIDALSQGQGKQAVQKTKDARSEQELLEENRKLRQESEQNRQVQESLKQQLLQLTRRLRETQGQDPGEKQDRSPGQ